MVQPQVVSFPLVSGVDQRVDALVAPAGVLGRVEGFQYGRDGELMPRKPFAAVEASTTAGADTLVAYQLAVRDDTLVALGDTDGNGYPTAVFEFIDAGVAWRREEPFASPFLYNVPMFTQVRTIGAPSTGVTTLAFAAAQTGEYVAAVYEGCFVAIWNNNGERLVLSTRLSRSGISQPFAYTEPKVVVKDGVFYFFARNTDNDHITAWSFAPLLDSAIQDEAADILNASLTPNGFSVAFNSFSSRWVLAVTTSDRLAVEFITEAWALDTQMADSGTGAGASPSVAAVPGLSTAFVTWHDTGDDRITVAAVSAAGFIASSDTVVDAAPDTDRFRCACSATSDVVVAVAAVTGDEGFVVSFRDPSDVTTELASSAFTHAHFLQAPVGGQNATGIYEVLMPVTLNGGSSNTERTVALLSLDRQARGFIELSDAKFLASDPNPGTRGIGTAGLSSQSFVFAYPVTTDGGGEACRVIRAVRGGWRAIVQADRGLVIGGGSPVMWDGAAAYEVGWHGRPIVEFASAGTSGALSANGAYRYAGVWAGVDRYGRDHVSAPSGLVATTLSGSEDSITFNASHPITMRGRSLPSPYPRFDAYRTISGGQVLLRDESLPLGPQVGADDFSDTLDQSDASIQGTETGFGRDDTLSGVTVLYSQARPEVSAPLPGDLVVYAANRVFLGARGGTDIQASLPLTPGEPLSFPGAGSSLAQLFRLESPEPMQAMGAVDDVLYVMGKRGVYATSASGGPDRQGLGGTFAPLARIPSDGGTDNPESLVSCSLGLFANIGGRLMLFPRGSSTPVWIGEPVRDLFEGRRVTAAALLEEAHEVAFFLDDGTSLALDLGSVSRGSAGAQWTTGVALDLANDVVSVVEHGGQVVVVDDTGDVLQQATGFSAATALARTWETEDLALGQGALGWGELTDFGALVSARGGCTIVASYSTDGGVTWTSAGNKSVPNTDTAGTDSALYWSTKPVRASRVRFRFVMTNLSGAEGCRFHALQMRGVPTKDQRAKGSSRNDG